MTDVIKPVNIVELNTLDVNSAVAQETVAEEPVIKPEAVVVKSANYEVKYSWSTPIDKINPGKETIALPAQGMTETRQQMISHPSIFSETTNVDKNWLNGVKGGLELNLVGEGLKATADDEGAYFVQAVASRRGELMSKEVKQRYVAGTKLQGAAAIEKMRQSAGLGVPFGVALWHSGFWIRLKAPSESSLLELYRQMNADKITLGRATYGFALSNSTSYQVKQLQAFISKHIKDTSVSFAEDQNPIDFINVTDLYTLIWGMACSIWPSGFQYVCSCIGSPVNCRHQIKEKLNLSALQWINSKALTEAQVSHMTNRDPNSMTVDSIKRYQADFIKSQDLEVIFNDKMKMVLRIPTIPEFVSSGYRWINGLETQYPNSLFADEDERNTYLIDQAFTSTMRQYAHFVKQIEFDDQEYTDLETIEGMLNELSSDDEIREMFYTKVGKFIDDSTFSFIAVPSFVCPSCKQDQSTGMKVKNQYGLIPLDAPAVFFIPLLQRLSAIKQR